MLGTYLMCLSSSLHMIPDMPAVYNLVMTLLLPAEPTDTAVPFTSPRRQGAFDRTRRDGGSFETQTNPMRASLRPKP